MAKKLTEPVKAYLFVYRFLYPQHYYYLLSQGMGVRWMPTWVLYAGLKHKRT